MAAASREPAGGCPPPVAVHHDRDVQPGRRFLPSTLHYKAPVQTKRPGVPSAIADGADERFHVVDVALERAPPRRRQAELGLRDPPLEALRAADVPGILELALVNDLVEVRHVRRLGLPLQLAQGLALSTGALPPGRRRLTHRTSSRSPRRSRRAVRRTPPPS